MDKIVLLIICFSLIGEFDESDGWHNDDNSSEPQHYSWELGKNEKEIEIIVDPYDGRKIKREIFEYSLPSQSGGEE